MTILTPDTCCQGAYFGGAHTDGCPKGAARTGVNAVAILTPKIARNEIYCDPYSTSIRAMDAISAIATGRTEVITHEQAELNREAWALIESLSGAIRNDFFELSNVARALIAKRNGT